MEGLTEILIQATRKVEGNYFSLPRYGDDDVLRERHYCYELYHQMRLLWPKGCRYYLSGEIDKRAHVHIKDLIQIDTIPDFLIHVPGVMDNDTIIEVKTKHLTRQGIRKDLRTLSLFIQGASYKRAIFLIFGEDIPLHLVDEIHGSYRNADLSGPIEIWFHNRDGVSAIHMCTLI